MGKTVQGNPPPRMSVVGPPFPMRPCALTAAVYVRAYQLAAARRRAIAQQHLVEAIEAEEAARAQGAPHV